MSLAFFDNDGVLVDTEKLFCEANQEMFDKMEIPHSKEEFQNYTQLTNLGSGGFLKTFGLSDEEIKTFKEKRDAIWNLKIEEGRVLA